ncbi:MAG: hypothetical protein HY906_09210 [Deltaproteobacteria bacterium]|nr:hypothetical protein [Deltaproteobacteria bacterium]
MRRSLVLLWAFAACAACGPNSDPSDQHDAGPHQDATFPRLDGAPYDAGVCEDVVDVVFVLDVSSSMDFVLDKLDAEIDSVVTAAAALAPEPHFGLIAFVDNFKLDDSGPLGGGAIHTADDTLKTAFQYYKATYTTPNRNPGDGPTGPTTQNPICEENSVDALYAAATTFPWRETASRVVILVTDDTFLERPDNCGDRDGDGLTDKTDFPREGDYPALRTMAEAVDALRAQRTRVFSFTRLQPPGPFSLTKCSTGRRLPWASVSDGWSTPYQGQQPIPARTDGANFDVEQVRAGTLSLSTTINQVVLQSYCNPPIL